MERNSESSFSDKVCFTNNVSYSLFFYENGSCLLVKAINAKELDSYLKKIEFDIYHKWSADQWFQWGVYKVQNDTVTMEFLEKVDQWGFMGMSKWDAILKNDRETIVVLPGPKNRKIKELNYFSISHTEIVLQKTNVLDSIKIDPTKAWVNR
ncbi:MAG: hypothetical protein ACK4SB_12880 [Belliella pelovolcani]